MGFLNAKIKKSLLSSFDEIDNLVRYVNNGGCGFFAKHLYNTLIKKGFKPELVLLVRGNSVCESYEHILNNDISALFKTAWVHVMVKVKTSKKVYYIDSKGIFDDLSTHPIFNNCNCVDMPFAILDTMLKSEYQHKWNNTFNRGDNKQIKKILVKHLEV
jgi:hypothetical protein